MTAPARFKQSDINRALRGARAAGFTNVRVKIAPDGTMDVIASDTMPTGEQDWRKSQPLYQDN